MKEIKVGEYVRIVKDYRILAVGIGKVKRIDKNKEYAYIEMKEETLQGLPMQINVRDIVKHSMNIIDLIEEGDYVNDCQVVARDENMICILTDRGQTCYSNIFENKQIKSIVTKEQFKSVEYIVGDNNE